jgi:hypothetical protein
VEKYSRDKIGVQAFPKNLRITKKDYYLKITKIAACPTWIRTVLIFPKNLWCTITIVNNLLYISTPYQKIHNAAVSNVHQITVAIIISMPYFWNSSERLRQPFYHPRVIRIHANTILKVGLLFCFTCVNWLAQMWFAKIFERISRYLGKHLICTSSLREFWECLKNLRSAKIKT